MAEWWKVWAELSARWISDHLSDDSNRTKWEDQTIEGTEVGSSEDSVELKSGKIGEGGEG